MVQKNTRSLVNKVKGIAAAAAAAVEGKNTFAVPRNVRALGSAAAEKPKAVEEGVDNKPKSNDEFRKMLMNK